MKKEFVTPEVVVTEIASQYVFAASDESFGGEDGIWEGLEDEALV